MTSYPTSKTLVLARMAILPLVFLTSLTSLMALKSRTLTLEGGQWNRGESDKTFINGDYNLQLTPEMNKVFSVTDSVIWDVWSDGGEAWVATGSEGGVSRFQKDRFHSRVQLEDKEITAIHRDGRDTYFGSGPQGKVFRISGSKSPVTWAETGEQFVWDMETYKGSLWAATGGERGKVFSIPLSGKVENLTPVLVVAEPNVLKLGFRSEGGVDYLYLSVSTAGKLYRTRVSDLKKGKAELEVIFDAGEKDVPDFVFADSSVYLITSGSGAGAPPPEAVSAPGEEGGLIEVSGMGEAGGIPAVSFQEGNENYLVRIGSDRDMEFVYVFQNQNPVRLIHPEQESYLYVGILEDAGIYRIDFAEKSLPGSGKIFSQISANLSGIFFWEGDLYFTLANLGDVYRLEKRVAPRGEYLSEVFDFNETVRWGQVVAENHNPGTSFLVFTRSGNSSNPNRESDAALTPVTDWSPWSEATEKISSPPARFLQLKLELRAGKGDFGTKPFSSPSPLVKKVEVFYGQKNSPHRITSLKLYKQEPNPLMLGAGGDQSGAGNPGGMFDVYSADHSLNTTYSTEDRVLVPSFDPNASQLPFPKIGKKEYVLRWDVQNFDQDTLVYDIYYRNYSSSTPGEWKVFRQGFLGSMLLLDGYKFIDGLYQFKVRAEDRLQNQQEDIFSSEAVSVLQRFDNQPPRLEEGRWEGSAFRFRVSDDLSRIDSVKYTGDRKTVTLLTPRDGIYDQGKEEFLFTPVGNEGVLIVKDAADNILYYNIPRKP